MLTYFNTGAIVAFSLFVAAGIWLGLVPHVLSTVAFAWTAATVLFLGGFSVVVIGRAQPTRSIAHVLYDVENPSARR
ncbi:MAG TPA: hypothetical protein VFX12_07245 [Vicinamibacterales bacterium]|nr:hypothetical protein [Vicinamibacterales bacterium]